MRANTLLFKPEYLRTSPRWPAQQLPHVARLLFLPQFNTYKRSRTIQTKYYAFCRNKYKAYVLRRLVLDVYVSYKLLYIPTYFAHFALLVFVFGNLIINIVFTDEVILIFIHVVQDACNEIYMFINASRHVCKYFNYKF